MNEALWLTTNSTREMIQYVADWTSERKLRLFACAFCRRILHMMRYYGSQQAVEVSERFADGQCSSAELQRSEGEARYWADIAEREGLPGWHAARMAALSTAQNARTAAEGAWIVDADHVRELFGNPFHPLTLSPSILSWNDSTVVRLAQAAYDERNLPKGTLDKGRLAILADALEEAGCTDEQILGHLRGNERHYRGCFVVDALLGKT
ncbi:MAG TPA: hypothetical protein VH682_29905 [Gemmataceae bacterium]|jgi:hypothetical protein